MTDVDLSYKQWYCGKCRAVILKTALDTPVKEYPFYAQQIRNHMDLFHHPIVDLQDRPKITKQAD